MTKAFLKEVSIIYIGGYKNGYYSSNGKRIKRINWRRYDGV